MVLTFYLVNEMAEYYFHILLEMILNIKDCE